MKKIGIITINDFGNYGNRLQCYAVQHYLESMGYSVENIYNTYRRSGFIVNSIKKVIQLLKYFSVRKDIDGRNQKTIWICWMHCGKGSRYI